MSLNFEYFVSTRYFSSKKNSSFVSFINAISIAGIIIGVAALIVVMSVMNGFRIELTEKILGFNNDVEIKSYSVSNIENWQNIISQVKKFQEVESAYPEISGQVLASFHKNSSGAIVKAMRSEDLEKREMISGNIIEGSMEGFNDSGNIIIGYALANNLGARVGDEVMLISPTGVSTVFGNIPRNKEYRIIGTFSSGMYQFDQSTIFMNFEDGDKYFQAMGNPKSIQIISKEPDKSNLLARKISEKFKGKYHVVDWQQSNEAIFNALKTERVAMFVILSLIIIVACFNIISSLVIMVKDKTKDIAILRTVGASRFTIMKIFLFTGSLIGIYGTIIGVVVGTLFAKNINTIKLFLESLTGTNLFDPVIYYLSSLPSHTDMADVVRIAITSITISLLSSLYPAYKASKLNPAEALRYE